PGEKLWREQQQAKQNPEADTNDCRRFHSCLVARLEISCCVMRPRSLLSLDATGSAGRPDQSISPNASRSDAVAAIGGPAASPGSRTASTLVSDSKRNGRSFMPT